MNFYFDTSAMVKLYGEKKAVNWCQILKKYLFVATPKVAHADAGMSLAYPGMKEYCMIKRTVNSFLISKKNGRLFLPWKFRILLCRSLMLD